MSVPWEVWVIMIPLAGGILAFLCERRFTSFIALFVSLGMSAAVAGLTLQVWRHGPQRHTVGGWGAPLGIDLWADGLSVFMLIMGAIVGVATSVYALSYFPIAPRKKDIHQKDHGKEEALFWPLWFFLWGALNALFLSADAFNLYVTLELLSLSAVALVNLAGGNVALVAGMRYLLTSLLASLAYLLGVVLLYSAFGSLALEELGARMFPSPLSWAAIALITTGLLLKSALFPLHFWLPPAHASAPAPVSAILSALVVKAAFYLLLRLWFTVFTPALTPAASQFLGALGAGAILWGSVLALRQQRLKLLVAYSTVAQLGYLFLLFPLTAKTGENFLAWSGGLYHALSHACAKTSMFLAAGTLMRALGHDRIDSLAAISHRLPITMFAFGIAGVTIMGLPPSGGFIAKWLLLNAALQQDQWWIVTILIVGGLLAVGYVFRVVQQAFVSSSEAVDFQEVSRSMEIVPLILALAALGLGLSAPPFLALLRIGAPFPSALSLEVGQ